ncbi:MAG: hypothetical protein ACOX6V_01225 [Patescibacteria group bacterium]|jgi:hypothetical protein
MAQIPMNVVQKIWDESEHSWMGLKDTIEEHRNAGSLSNDQADQMVEAINMVEDDEFPQTPGELHAVMNKVP